MTDGTTAGRGRTLALGLLGAGFLGNGLWMLAAVAAVFLGIHALVHVVESATGALPPGSWLADLPGVHLPALVVAGLALSALRAPTPEVSR